MNGFLTNVETHTYPINTTTAIHLLNDLPVLFAALFVGCATLNSFLQCPFIGAPLTWQEEEEREELKKINFKLPH